METAFIVKIVRETMKKMSSYFKKTDKMFYDYRKHTLDYSDKAKRRVFIDNNADILLVCHLDTICSPRVKEKDGVLYGAGFDDRIGLYAAEKLIEMGMNADILACDLEESANSTAQWHDCKEYNWIVELDRAGDDVVTYDLSCLDLDDKISKYWKIGIGAFSDICYLDTDSACFNLGIGYKYAHSEKSECDMKILQKQLDKLMLFYHENKDISYKQEYENQWKTRHDYYSSDLCEICGYDYGENVYGTTICKACFDTMMECNTDTYYL